MIIGRLLTVAPLIAVLAWPAAMLWEHGSVKGVLAAWQGSAPSQDTLRSASKGSGAADLQATGLSEERMRRAISQALSQLDVLEREIEQQRNQELAKTADVSDGAMNLWKASEEGYSLIQMRNIRRILVDSQVNQADTGG